jgi:hypothetical protein
VAAFAPEWVATFSGIRTSADNDPIDPTALEDTLQRWDLA